MNTLKRKAASHCILHIRAKCFRVSFFCVPVHIRLRQKIPHTNRTKTCNATVQALMPSTELDTRPNVFFASRGFIITPGRALVTSVAVWTWLFLVVCLVIQIHISQELWKKRTSEKPQFRKGGRLEKPRFSEMWISCIVARPGDPVD